MGDFIRAGGFPMILTTLVGIGAVVYAFKALTEPTARALAVLRALPALLMVHGLIGMAAGFRAMGLKLSDPEFLGRVARTPQELATIGFVGTGETMCNVIYAGAFAFVLLVVRILAERKLAKG